MSSKESNGSESERPPVVVVLGHVDHGKTTLLDTIRKTNVAGRESGGITQHVGAYVVEHQGKMITFLDTPGHAAFSAMRRRGAQVADLAVLVVAADDGMQPQTHEALEAIRAVDIPYVVAINKIDKPNADLDKTKADLTQADVLLEGWGGDIPNVEISAKEGTKIDDLLEIIQLLAEMAELRGDASAPAEGVVIEAHQDPRKGTITTALVKNGTLRVGDVVVAGSITGKVKALEDFEGNGVKEAGPSMPTVILGLNEVPEVGDALRAVATEAAATAAAAEEKERRSFEVTIREGEPSVTFPLLIKSDVRGSLEAIIGELEKLKNKHVALQVIAASTGDITENDVKQAGAMGATIFGFRIKARNAITNVAERNDVTVRAYDVIYELMDAVKAEAEERLPKIVTRDDVGTLEVLGAFKYDHPNHVIGGRVTSGVARRGVLVEVIRGEDVVARATVTELQRDKMPVDEVEQDRECGMLVKYTKGGPVQVGDTINFFTETIETPSINS